LDGSGCGPIWGHISYFVCGDLWKPRETSVRTAGCPHRDLNPGVPEYEAGMPSTRQRHSASLLSHALRKGPVLMILWTTEIKLSHSPIGCVSLTPVDIGKRIM
jgi:hypothetical protein